MDKVVELSYTARVEDGKVFDTTSKAEAEKAGIYNENDKYIPQAIVLGAEEILKGVENAIKEMKVGERKKIVLKAEDAFGERKVELARVISLKEFRKREIQPFPGLVVDLDGHRGKVQSVSGGRVRVDFNHPLAGKTVEYDVKLESEIKGVKAQVEALYNKYFGPIPEKDRNLQVKEGVVEIGIDPKYEQAVFPIKKMFSDLLTKHVEGVKSVKFVQEFKEEKTAEAKKEVKDTTDVKEKIPAKKKD